METPSAPPEPPQPQNTATENERFQALADRIAVLERERSDDHVTKAGIPKPDNAACPNCEIGLLYATVWDEDSTHEKGQPIYAPLQLSGGTVAVVCLSCGHSESRAMDPREAPPNPLPGA